MVRGVAAELGCRTGGKYQLHGENWEGGGSQGIFSRHKSTIHCISNCSGIRGIDRISYCFTGWLGTAVLQVSYCNKGPWLAGQLPSSPLPGYAHYWLLQPEAPSSAISLLKRGKKNNNTLIKNKTGLNYLCGQCRCLTLNKCPNPTST